jgi:hypothetical protein
MALKKSELYSSLWQSCDELRGGMDASQYKDYVLVLLFLKYISDKHAGRRFAPITIPPGASFKDMVALKGRSDIGDQINKSIIGPLAKANQQISQADFPDFNDPVKLGDGKEKVERLTNLIAIFENPALDFSKNRADGDDILGDAYEYLMRHFATDLRGGIPIADIDVDALERYWAVCPQLRNTLFKKLRRGYLRLAVQKPAIKPTIYEHPEFASFIAEMNAHFTAWRKKRATKLKALEAGCHPKEVIAEMAESLLAHYTGKPLIDRYDAYQHLMDYWAETMQDDCYLIAADGWKATTYRIIEKDKKGKEKDKGWACDLIPKALLVVRYFSKEQAVIDQLAAELESVTARLTEMEEEHGGEDGAFSELDKVNKANVAARLKEIQDDKDAKDEAAVLNDWLKLNNEETDIKKRLKEAEVALDVKALARYPKLMPGFSGKWEVSRLGDVADTDPENLGSDTRSNFSFNYIALEDVDVGTLRSYSQQVFQTAPSRARRKLRKGDVLVSTVRSNLMSHLLFPIEGDHWVCSTGFCVVRCREGVSHPGYVYFHMSAGCVARQIEALLTGSNYPAINGSDVRALQIPFPEYKEQTAIAAALSEMDAEITALEAKLTKARQLKQGMMQELLTGRIRLV